jgi:hypothetical protein
MNIHTDTNSLSLSLELKLKTHSLYVRDSLSRDFFFFARNTPATLFPFRVFLLYYITLSCECMVAYDNYDYVLVRVHEYIHDILLKFCT